MYKIILKGYKTNTILNNFLNACDVLDGEVLEKTELAIWTKTVPTDKYIKNLITHLHKGEFKGQRFENMRCVKIVKEG